MPNKSYLQKKQAKGEIIQLIFYGGLIVLIIAATSLLSREIYIEKVLKAAPREMVNPR